MSSNSVKGLAVAVFAAALASPAAALDPEQIFAKDSPAVWVVRAGHGDSKNVALGSAVVIAPRRLVTACHVVIGATEVTVAHDNGAHVIKISAVTHDPDKARDLCLLSTASDIGAAPVPIAPASDVKVGERVYAIGAPLGLEMSLTDGLVSALRHHPGEDLPRIQTSAAIAPGSSGGGLFDSDGRLIGVTVAIASEQTDNLAFAYPAQWVFDVPARLAAEAQKWRATLAADGARLQPSNFAPLTKVDAVPTDGKPATGVALAYRQFLLLNGPRVFLLTSDGRWGTVTDPAQFDAIMKDCAARDIRCGLYAIDDQVVWRPQS